MKMYLAMEKEKKAAGLLPWSRGKQVQGLKIR